MELSGNLDFKYLKMKITAFLILLGFTFFSFGQNKSTNSGGQSKQIQPSIIVIPKLKKGEDIRNVLDNNFNLRLGISIMKEAFDKRGFTTYDFEATLRKCETMNLLTSNDQATFQDAIVKNSSADMFITLDVNIDNNSNGNMSTVLFECFETYTGRSLANDQSSSNRLRLDDNKELIMRAINDENIEPFMKTIQSKFTEIVENGLSIQIFFGLEQGATITYDDNIGNNSDILSELIMDWMDKNAYKNYAKIANQTATQILYEDVRIPLKDQETGMNYDPRKFGRSLRQYLVSLGLNPTIQYPRGQIIIQLK
jgi:hypothetical protein